MQRIIKKTNPATGHWLADVPCVAPEGVPALVIKARQAQVAWGQKSVVERARAMRRVAAVLSERAASLADVVSAETGKPVVEAMLHEVFNVAHLANYFGKRAPRILRDQAIPLSMFMHRRSFLHYVPRGVIGVISPWNFPLSLPLGESVMALCAGNAVVLKPSEQTPLTALEVPTILAAADIDPDLVQVAVGHGDVGAALVGAGVDMIHFTGSVATGRKIATACGERLLPCVLELGGKDAAIVLEDADIEHAARTLVFGAFLNAGQACASVERVYAMEGVYEPLVKRLVELTQALRSGDGGQEDVDVGPMIVDTQLDIVRRQVDEAKAAGATIRCGGEAPGGLFYRPTVVTDVTDDMRLCSDETFGPVMPVAKVGSVDEAIRRANDTIYGLSAYVFTRNKARGLEVARRLRAGTVDVNDVLFTHAAPETPWGGVKASGIGHTHADSGLRHLCEARHVNYSPLPPFLNLWMFPYRRAMIAPMQQLLQGLFGQNALLYRIGLLCRGLWGAACALTSRKTDNVKS